MPDNYTKEDSLTAARSRLEKRWGDQGACRSCGWHSALYEHSVTDADLAQALDGDGFLSLPCMSKDDESAETHRGIRVNVAPVTL